MERFCLDTNDNWVTAGLGYNASVGVSTWTYTYSGTALNHGTG